MPQISSSTPAPTMGWVTNKNIGQMEPNEALVLTNYFPQANTVDLINGYTEHATGAGSAEVGTLLAWNGPSNSKMLAAGGGELWDVTSVGAATSLSSGYANDRWQWVNFETTGGNFVIAVNGADDPINFNGTAVSTSPAITGAGLTASDLIGINVFKNRIFLVEKDSLNFWYLPVSNIGGAASKFPLGQWCTQGGYLVAMGTWTRDGGNGMDDLAVFITSKGECLVYEGSDPGTATDWSLIGVFNIGEPIGRRCMAKFANDLIVITLNGFIPLSKVLSLGVSAASAIAISAQISPTVNSATKMFKNNFGWECTVYPQGNFTIFNIPISPGSQIEQYVVNSQTGAWCKFTQHNAATWLVFNEELYFGGLDGRVMQADNEHTFDGDAIPGDLETSFNYFGNTAQIKRFQMVRPIMFASGDVTFSYVVNTDFREMVPALGSSISTTGTPWGSPWGSPWSAEVTLSQRWLSGGTQGRNAAFRMRTNTINFTISLSALDWIMDVGGVI